MSNRSSGLRRYMACLACSADFSDMNTRTPEGWIETQISGYCEDCFDVICAEPEEDDK